MVDPVKANIKTKFFLFLHLNSYPVKKKQKMNNLLKVILAFLAITTSIAVMANQPLYLIDEVLELQSPNTKQMKVEALLISHQ